MVPQKSGEIARPCDETVKLRFVDGEDPADAKPAPATGGARLAIAGPGSTITSAKTIRNAPVRNPATFRTRVRDGQVERERLTIQLRGEL